MYNLGIMELCLIDREIGLHCQSRKLLIVVRIVPKRNNLSMSINIFLIMASLEMITIPILTLSLIPHLKIVGLRARKDSLRLGGGIKIIVVILLGKD